MKKHPMIKKLSLCIAVALVGLCSQPVMAQHIAVKTNVLSDLGLVPSIGTELVIGEKSSLNVELMGTVAKPWGLDYEMTMGSLQYRYWISNRSLTQLFVGAGLKAGAYTYNNKKGMYKADMATAEVVAGYAWPLSKRWNLEVSYGWGLLVRYANELPATEGATEFLGMKYDIATTSIGVNFVYILK